MLIFKNIIKYNILKKICKNDFIFSYNVELIKKITFSNIPLYLFTLNHRKVEIFDVSIDYYSLLNNKDLSHIEDVIKNKTNYDVIEKNSLKYKEIMCNDYSLYYIILTNFQRNGSFRYNTFLFHFYYFLTSQYVVDNLKRIKHLTYEKFIFFFKQGSIKCDFSGNDFNIKISTKNNVFLEKIHEELKKEKYIKNYNITS